ncbi:MAG: transposase [Nitrospiraceae bacterium]|nr:transposase [Nitrospiraceae bacterium]
MTWCDWTLFITNAPEAWLPLNMVRALYTLRWQIELVFKQFKSILRVHHSTTSNEHRVRCELYGKWITAVWVHRLHTGANHRAVADRGPRDQPGEVVQATPGARLSACTTDDHLVQRKGGPICLVNSSRYCGTVPNSPNDHGMTTLAMLEARVDPQLSPEQNSS